MKVYLTTLALIVMLAFIADTKIVLWPFSISFGRGWLTLGIILIMCGCICLKMQWYDDGLRKGAEIKEDAMKEAVKEYREQLKKESI